MIIEILQQLPRQRFTTAAHLCHALAAAGYARDLRSVQRLLDQMLGHFPIECDRRNKPYGYRWQADAQDMRLAQLTPAEALLVQIAHSHVQTFLPRETARQLGQLFIAAERTLQTRPGLGAERRWLKKVRRIPNTQPLLAPRVRPGVLDAISEALYYEQKLLLNYRNARGKRTEARVAPLGLALQEPRLYLVCRFDGYENQRILSLVRIEHAQALPERFIYPRDFDLEHYDGEGRFAFGEGKRVRLQLEIDKQVGRHLTESPLSLDQKTRELEESLCIEATVIDSMLLHAWLRGFGDALKKVSITPA